MDLTLPILAPGTVDALGAVLIAIGVVLGVIATAAFILEMRGTNWLPARYADQQGSLRVPAASSVLALPGRFVSGLTPLEKLLLLFLIFADFYYVYRYIFRYSSGISSFGYDSTPDALQYPKYAAAVAVLLLFGVLLLRNMSFVRSIIDRMLRQPIWPLLIVFALYVGISTLKYPLEFGGGSAGATAIKMLFVIPFAFVAPFIWADKRPTELIKRFFIISITYHVLSEVVMVYLRTETGRLPSLSFADLLARYGGGWDDPNGFAAFLLLGVLTLLLIKFPADRARQLLLYGCLALLMLLVLLAYSGTSAVGLAVIVGLVFLAGRLDIRRAALLGAVCGVFFLAHSELGYTRLIYEGKTLSFEGRLAADRNPEFLLQDLIPPAPGPGTSGTAPRATNTPRPPRATPVPTRTRQPRNTPVPTRTRAPTRTPGPAPTRTPTVGPQFPALDLQLPTLQVQSSRDKTGMARVFQVILGDTDRLRDNENIYIRLYWNYGLVGLVLFIIIHLLTLRQAFLGWVRSKDVDESLATFFLLSGIYLFAFAVMNAFISFYYVFPINLFIWLLIGLIWTMPILEPRARAETATAP